jgi:precorrin-8X/cobalt-precorrin-8 methylmutase
MTAAIVTIRPEAIEARSFAIIEEEFEGQTGRRPQEFTPEEFAIIRRVIHATGDFSFAHSLRFHPGAIALAIAMLRAGRALVTDVRMTMAGISKAGLSRWGCQVLCELGRADLAAEAAARGLTRSETAILSALAHGPGLIVIGNAPTALLSVIKRCQEETGSFQGVIIGVPVGFVNAAESKDLLASQAIPHITSLGRKGGSPVAAAIVNALIRLAAEGSTTA